MDRTFLSWPFFEPKHRQLADELQSWCEAVLPDETGDLEADCRALVAELGAADILKLCVDHGGCLTGEHGVGVEKRDLMRHQYAEADLAQQMRLRAAFDPKWIMNPSKVFPLEGRVG